MTGRILHISDLHVGRLETPEPLSVLAEHIRELTPRLLVVSGDLTHRGRTAQLEHARELLESLAVPYLAVPGNHDIPYRFTRFTAPFGKWKRVFGDVEPAHASEALSVQGVCSVRPWRQQGGSVGPMALDRVRATFEGTPDRTLRVVVFHHHVASPPWRAAGKNPVRHRDVVLRALAAARANLVLGGHVHQGAIVERREFEVLDEQSSGSLVLATVPGFGRPRPHRRGEAVGFNVYEWDDDTLHAHTWAWADGRFERVGERSFQRR